MWSPMADKTFQFGYVIAMYINKLLPSWIGENVTARGLLLVSQVQTGWVINIYYLIYIYIYFFFFRIFPVI